MKIKIVDDYEEMSRQGAQIVIDQLIKKPSSVLGLATGSTPVGLYKNLVEAYARGEITFSSVRTVNLDEYIGIRNDNPNSYHAFMQKYLFGKVDIKSENVNIPSGTPANAEIFCKLYNLTLNNLPRDIQILGLGSNGHIGFNEPGTPFKERTHVVRLAQSTINDNARFFSSPEEVPQSAITMGISDIMQAKKIILMASGENKARAVKDMVKGYVTEYCPATSLRNHPDCIVILDRAAAKYI